jgi:hypothetical protein
MRWDLSPFVAVLAASVIALPLAATAGEVIGVLAIEEPPGPSPQLVEATAQLRAVLAGRTRGVLDATALRERMIGEAPRASLSEIDLALAGAVATFQAGDYEGALRTFKAVVDDVEKLPDGPDVFAQWTRAMLRLARAEQTLGRRAELAATLERLVRAAPHVKVDATQYPTSFASEVDAVRARLTALPKRKLTVTATQPGVKVFVDGREAGTAPVTLSLVPGRHRVSGRHGALRVPGVVADTSQADQIIALDLDLAQALRPEAGPGLALARTGRAHRIAIAGAWLGLDRAVTTSLVRELDVAYLQGTLFDVRRGIVHREARLRLTSGSPPAGGLAALAAFLMTGEPSTLVAAVPSGGAQAAAKPEGEGGAKPSADLAVRPPARAELDVDVGASKRGSRILRWSPVVAAGLAVGLGAVAGYEALQASRSYSRASDLVSSGSLRLDASPHDYNAYVSDGNSQRQVAVASGIGAGVALLTSGALGWLSYSRTGEIGPFRF